MLTLARTDARSGPRHNHGCQLPGATAARGRTEHARTRGGCACLAQSPETMHAAISANAPMHEHMRREQLSPPTLLPSPSPSLAMCGYVREFMTASLGTYSSSACAIAAVVKNKSGSSLARRTANTPALSRTQKHPQHVTHGQPIPRSVFGTRVRSKSTASSPSTRCLPSDREARSERLRVCVCVCVCVCGCTELCCCTCRSASALWFVVEWLPWARSAQRQAQATPLSSCRHLAA